MEIINGVNIDVVIGDCSTDLFNFLKTTHLKAEKFKHTAEICDNEKNNFYIKIEDGVTLVRTEEGLFRTKPFVFVNCNWAVKKGFVAFKEELSKTEYSKEVFFILEDRWN